MLVIKLVDVRAAKELSNNDQDELVDQDRLASNNRLSCEEIQRKLSTQATQQVLVLTFGHFSIHFSVADKPER